MNSENLGSALADAKGVAGVAMPQTIQLGQVTQNVTVATYAHPFDPNDKLLSKKPLRRLSRTRPISQQ